MKLSVSAFRAQASAQRKILSSYQNQLNYGACTTFPSLGGFKLEPQMMVDSTGLGLPSTDKSSNQTQSSETSQEEADSIKMVSHGTKETIDNHEEAEPVHVRREESSDKSPGRTRTKSNQRWMKLRTTVQLSGAISTNQKSKPTLKREDSFLKRFSTRQIPETQETVDTGDDTETVNGAQTHNEVTRRRRKRRKELAKTVVNPDENFYFYWLMMVTLCVLYNLWTLIVRQSFPELQKAASAFWYSGDGFTDFVFICDIVVQFRTGYLEQGLMVYDSKKLASHYLKSRAFLLDLLSLLPLDFLQFNIGVNPILRFPRFLKVYRIYNYYYMVESRTVYPNLWRVVNLIHILLILAHWFGCFYYLLSEAEGFQGEWVYPYREGDYSTLTRKYLGSLYWSTLTLTTIGDLPTPETNAESRGRSKAMTHPGDPHPIPRRGHKSRLLQFNSNSGYLFTIVSYLIGVFIFATIVGQVGNVITNRNANRLEFERLLDGAKTYMRHHKVPGGMKRRVLRWYDYSWSRGRIQGGGDINTALGLLPDKLKTELALHVNLSVLKKVTIFQECQPEFLHDLVLKMKAYIFTPGDLICRKGEVAREMFIIADGILDVISETGRVLTTMKAGDFFGEIGILNLDGLNKRTADVRSVGYSELFSLSREDVLTAMKDYPEAQEILQNLGRKRLMEAKNASKMHRTQAKQTKDHDSSGDSDTAGKRIVEKLRSDVKGLKNVLRRSRRGTKIKNACEDYQQAINDKSLGKRQGILRRMSHVQSSDELEGSNETMQSPIGAGLPLLQRLKFLKEKQEREKVEKEKLNSSFQISTKEHRTEVEPIGIGLPLMQRLRLLKQKEEREALPVADSASVDSSHATGSTTVRTQHTGVRFEKHIGSRCKTIKSTREGNQAQSRDWEVISTQETQKPNRMLANERFKAGDIAKNLPSKDLPKETIAIPSNFIASQETKSETSNNMPQINAEKLVPTLLDSQFEVPKTQDGWKQLKKSSLTKLKDDKTKSKNTTSKTPKKGIYLPKSDTVLEKQENSASEKMGDESLWPGLLIDRSVSQELKMIQTTKSTDSINEKITNSNKKDEEIKADDSERKSIDDFDTNRPIIKKYDSISDLSPEYSGLPFVKKLKILNERQKLAEQQKEMLVRSASFDFPDESNKLEKVLVRSRSEASSIEINRDENFRATLEAKWRNSILSETDTTINRRLKIPESKPSEESIASPESNETMERKHLKSILKKLSAEESTSDEDQILKIGLKEPGKLDMKKLLRAPTIEGYAARHKKFQKSVTFDRGTLLSTPEPVSFDAATEEEPKTKGFPPLSPTAILTLQLSNLSMMPIVGSRNLEKTGTDKNMTDEKSWNVKKIELESIFSKLFEKLQEEIQKFRSEDPSKAYTPMPYNLHGLSDKTFRILPYAKTPQDELFAEIVLRIQEIIQTVLEELETKYRFQCNNLEKEVKKRDEIIQQLQSQLQLYKQRNPNEAIIKFTGVNNSENKSTEETNQNSSDSSAQREYQFEEIFRRNSCETDVESHNVFPFERSTKSRRKKLETKLFDYPLEYFGNVITCPDAGNNSGNKEEVDDEFYEIKNKIKFLSSINGKSFKRHFQRSTDITSDDELELLDAMKSRLDNFKKKRQKQELKLRRNYSADETHLPSFVKSQRRWSSQDDKNKLCGRLINPITDSQGSFSCSYKNNDFVALDIDDSSGPSDGEQQSSKDWEVQMLVEELEKKERIESGTGWEIGNWISEREEEVEQLTNMKRLQEEVDTLKQMVCGRDLTLLSTSELDMLETIIEAKDQKIAQISRSNSLDHEEKRQRHRKSEYMCSSGSDNKLEKFGHRKKASLKQKIGHAFSFDFHDIENRKLKTSQSGKRKGFPLRKQKTISGSCQDSQNVISLWHTSSLLRNRVLEGREERELNQAKQLVNSRSSLPVLISKSLDFEKRSNTRTSLPSLSSKEFSFIDARTIVSASDKISAESDFERSSDPVFEKPEQLELRNYPATSGELKSTETHFNTTFNNFIKSVGQKVKQAVVGEMSTAKNPVPTISKLCEDQSLIKDQELEDFGVTGVPCTETKQTEKESSLDGSPKTE